MLLVAENGRGDLKSEAASWGCCAVNTDAHTRQDLSPDFPQMGDHFVFCLSQSQAACSAHLLLEQAELSLPGFVAHFSQAALHSLRNEVEQVGIGEFFLRPQEFAVQTLFHFKSVAGRRQRISGTDSTDSSKTQASKPNLRRWMCTGKSPQPNAAMTSSGRPVPTLASASKRMAR